MLPVKTKQVFDRQRAGGSLSFESGPAPSNIRCLMPDYPFNSTARELPATVPFVGPETQERARGEVFAARLGANENMFGPSPRAIEAMEQAASEVWMYGDPANHDLREALARHHNVAPENIMVGEGIDGMFGTMALLFMEPGACVATSAGGYPTFNYQMAARGGTIETTPFVDDKEDLGGLLDLAARTKARLIYLANPDNPMGTWWDGTAVAEMIDNVPEGSLLCLDEAYIDFAPPDMAPALDVSSSKIIRFRTFSKAYGMAGARIGYVIGEASLIQAFDKVRNHFGVNRIAQAGALAALKDQEFLGGVVKKVAAARTRIAEIGTAHGFSSLPSATNFVTMDCGRDAAFSTAIVQGLANKGVFIRKPFMAPQDRCIRISAGMPKDLDLFEGALTETLAELN